MSESQKMILFMVSNHYLFSLFSLFNSPYECRKQFAVLKGVTAIAPTAGRRERLQKLRKFKIDAKRTTIKWTMIFDTKCLFDLVQLCFTFYLRNAHLLGHVARVRWRGNHKNSKTISLLDC